MFIQILVVLLITVRVHGTMKCPYYCSCDKWEGLRRISCVGQSLASSEVNAPALVQALDLSTNSISELKDKGFYHYHNLKYLNISHNKMIDIHMSAFHGLNQLNILDLSHNHLKFLTPIAFEDTPVLQELYLSGNEIGHFGKPPVFNIPSLQVLQMKECWLDSMDEMTFSLLPNLMILDLSDNQFVFLRIDYLRTLSQLNVLNLLGNPWHCSSEIEEAIAHLNERNVNVTQICETDSRKEIAINGSGMFERIISIKDSSESEEDEYDDIETLDEDIYRIWFADDDEIKILPRDEDKLELEKVVYSTDNLLEQIPSLWAFILGLHIGTALSVIGMWVWFRCKCSHLPAQPPIRAQSVSFQTWRRSMGRHRTEERCYTELESVDCPGTPPPPYRDVALRTFR